MPTDNTFADTSRQRDALIREIGRLILTDPNYAGGNWRGIALVYTFEPGVETTDGYIYFPEASYFGKDYKPELPDDNSDAIAAAVNSLRELSASGKDGTWQQMLYQIWMPGPDFRATFEYDNPRRWSLGSTTADGAGSFADLIDPQNRG